MDVRVRDTREDGGAAPIKACRLSTKIVFIGYERNSGTKTYCFYDPRTKRIRISRDVVFEEKQVWIWGTTTDDAPGAELQCHARVN